MTQIIQLMPQVASRITKTELINWQSLAFLQDDGFKVFTADGDKKLQESLLRYQFVDPFKVWMSEGVLYCLDGKHRFLDLKKIKDSGVEVPDQLPATFIECQDKKEAAELILIYSSRYATITQQGFHKFLSTFDLEYRAMSETIDLPDFSTDRYEQQFDLFGVQADDQEYDVEDPEEVVVKPGDLFCIGGHRIACASFKDDQALAALMKDELGRILLSDPPYNLPVNFFTNKEHDRHQDFAMAAGEMSDEEFVSFLQLIMATSQANTVTGAIHYIFMDHRHAWHICEAAKRVYGSPIPKQVCTWVKDIMANGSFYRAQQEFCFIFSGPGAKALWHNDLIDQGGFYKPENELCFIFKNGDGAKHLSHLELKDRIRTNVWRYPSANSRANPDKGELKNHPTPKIVRMLADAILDTTNPDDIVLDWFLGSGTTLIAAEKTGRRCFGTEIEPKFIQLIIKRYIRYCELNDKEIIFKHENGTLTLNDFAHEPVTH